MTTSRAERTNPEERRQQIMETAIALADSVGLDRLTSRDIAGELGIAKGLVHHYFATMDDLIVAAFDHFATDELATVATTVDELPAMPALREYMARYLTLSGRSARLWMGAWVAAPRRPALAAVVERQMQAGQNLLAALLTRGAADGSFELEEPTLSAFRILALLDGVLVQVSMRSDQAYGDLDVLIRDTVEREVGLPAGYLGPNAPTSGARRSTRRKPVASTTN